MKYLLYALRAMLVTIKNAFGPTVTEFYGRPETDRGERFRTSFALLYETEVPGEDGQMVPGKGEERCIGCKKCESICPSEIIEVIAGPKAESPLTGKKRGYMEDFTLDMNACIYCELCVQVCPSDAIVMLATHQPPVFSREDLVLTRARLYDNGETGTLSWATGSLLTEMQDPGRGSPPPDAKPTRAAAAEGAEPVEKAGRLKAAAADDPEMAAKIAAAKAAKAARAAAKAEKAAAAGAEATPVAAAVAQTEGSTADADPAAAPPTDKPGDPAPAADPEQAPAAGEAS